MSKVGRNDHCPCGRGKKYKKCCLAKDEEAATHRREEEQAVQMAISWLLNTYPDETTQAVNDDFLGRLTDEEIERLDELPAWQINMFNINSAEWLLTDGVLTIDGTPKPVPELLMGAGGPLLPARGRNWLKTLAEFPLSIYEVQESKPDEGMQLRDLLNPVAPPVWVQERSASKSLGRWDILGTRLAQRDGSWVLTGALYLFDRQEGLDCRDLIFETIGSEPLNDQDRRMLVGTVIIDNWLMGLVADRDDYLPEMVDAATGDTILLTTDHYNVLDWPAFERILASQDDIDGDRKAGWNRFTELANEQFRSRASMVAQDSGLLEVFCRTPRLADEARQWLETIAGDLITYKIREVVDPLSKKALSAAAHKPQPDIPQEVQQQVLHQHLAKHYETWPEISLPALKGKTPLEAAKDERLRPMVIELLKSMEQLEARRSNQAGGALFDVSFLWDRLGIER
jgi:hypothetical protein